MHQDDRDALLQRLKALERQSERFQSELQQLKQELLRRTKAEPPAAAVRPRPATESATAAETTAPPGRPQPPSAAASERAKKRSVDLEFWLGGRGLLLLGVAALVLAVGFFVKEAIERGWIGPALRVTLGAGVGILAVVVGERIRAVGHRTYGLWLAAGGFSAIYLSIWAAAELYALVSIPLGFLLLVVVVVAAAAQGLLRDSESFLSLAAFGGYLAPILLRVETASSLFGLGYLGLLSAAGLWVAYRSGWVYLASVAVVGGTVLSIASDGDPHLHGVYLAALVAAALTVSRRRRWHYLSLLAVVFGWIAVGGGSENWDLEGLKLAFYGAALWLANLIASVGVTDWVTDAEGQAEQAAPVVSDRPALRLATDAFFREVAGLGVIVVPPSLFFLAAIAGVDESAYRDSRDAIAFVLALLLGAVYAGQAHWGRPGIGAGGGAWRAALGYLFWLGAPTALWEDVGLVRAWLVEGIVFTGAGVLLKQLQARATGLAALTLAVLTYWGAEAVRSAADPALISGWALSGLVACLGLAGWSLALGRVDDSARWEIAIRPALFLASAFFFLGWGTAEIFRFYDLLGEATRWVLARDLSISSFWIAYAALLLAAGFWLQRPPVRWAGLAMALIAAGKVFLYDLSQLSQLYRIVSFVLLAIVLLALSFRYQRWRRA